MDMEHALKKTALSIRSLTIDAVERAASGHPGLPLGLAEAGALLFGEVLKHNPAAPDWIDRDRFVLSAGHGSMLLYSLLHLSGYDLTLEDLKNFRQRDSRTPGHPETGKTPGVETTTGPLGQGVANAVGMAVAEKMLAAAFNTDDHAVIDHHTYVIAGDGDMMEGISSEAASLAGHWKLGKLIVFYDSNKITIDGSTDLAFTEDVQQRYEAYGWRTFRVNAYDVHALHAHIESAKTEQNRPTLIVLESIIGKGSPHKAGTAACHGSPLGAEEARLTKRALGIPETGGFYVDEDARAYFREKRDEWGKGYEAWRNKFEEWKKAHPGLYEKWERFFSDSESLIDSIQLPVYQEGAKIATRDSNGAMLNALAAGLPNLVGGSADLASSNKTRLAACKDFQAATPDGRNLNFGVREHAMGAITNGLALHGGFRPFCATFFVFSDYMKPAIRLAAIMKLPVIYFFTHDSLYVGEDGPTHQPVEQFAGLRAIPHLDVWRPGDAEENAEILKRALARRDGPSLLGLTRQGVPVYRKEDHSWRDSIANGAYMVKDAAADPAVVIIATGSEVATALDVHRELGRNDVRVVSMPCRERFCALSRPERERLIPPGARRVIIEAGVSMGWEGIAGEDGVLVCMNDFGISAKLTDVASHFGFDPKKIAEKIRAIPPVR